MFELLTDYRRHTADALIRLQQLVRVSTQELRKDTAQLLARESTLVLRYECGWSMPSDASSSSSSEGVIPYPSREFIIVQGRVGATIIQLAQKLEPEN
jgi:hypothetical protein